MLNKRLTFGPIMIAALIGLLWLDEAVSRIPLHGAIGTVGGADHLPPGLVLLGLALAVSALVSRELAFLFRSSGARASARAMWACGAVGLFISFIAPMVPMQGSGVAFLATAAVIVLIGTTLWHIRHREVEGITAAIAGSMFALVYIGLLFGFLLALRHHRSAWVVLGVLITTKSSDIGAYFTGVSLGRHKLVPWLSPGKTWEGLAGGMVIAGVVAAVGVLLSRLSDDPMTRIDLPIWLALIAGGMFAVVGQAGDLMASLMKRDAGVKDSGRMIPGFGGILDVVDSLLFVSPIAYWLLAT